VTRGNPTYIITMPERDHITINAPVATPKYRCVMTNVRHMLGQPQVCEETALEPTNS
jgi:hypothetical protein